MKQVGAVAIALFFLLFSGGATAQGSPIACDLTAAGDGLPDDWGADLRLLYFGIEDDSYDVSSVPLAPVTANCNAMARRDLATACGLYHVYRPDDGATSSADLKVQLKVAADQPYCNAPTTPSPGSGASDKTDADPIRVSCAQGEDVCRCDGTLGLLLPIAVPLTSAAYPASTLYPVLPCDGAAGLFFSPTNSNGNPVATNPALGGWCSDGSEKLVNGCTFPKHSSGVATCMYFNVDQLGVQLATLLRSGTLGNPACPDGDAANDARSFNLNLRDVNGTLLAGGAIDWEGHAWYRLHMISGATAVPGAVECQELDSVAQIECLMERDTAAGLASVGFATSTAGCVAFNDGDPCTESTCDPITGALNPAVDSDDGNPCTVDLCDPETGALSHTPEALGVGCQLDLCTPGSCDGAGTCEANGLPAGDDSDPCTIETCDPLTGVQQRSCAPIDVTVASNVQDTMEWLYSGPDPIQTGVDGNDIEFQRAALVHGAVTDQDGFSVYGVQLLVAGRPEFGQTVTQTDGSYQLVVNGGGVLTVEYNKDGFLHYQRQVQVPWGETVEVPAVVLVKPDPVVTGVDLLDDSEDFQVISGSVINDADGARQATLLFPAGAEAMMFHANGTSEPLTAMNIRATEFTVGPNGPAAMPAALPLTSGYTYSIEFNADEAVAAGAPSIEFSQPLPAYITNFLGFPAGTVVPLGAYDRELHQWVSHESGVVIEIVAIGSGGAEIDVTGDGVADTGPALAAFNITPEELVQIAGLYSIGDSLWRIEVPHFTRPYDCNWPVGPPNDAAAPPGNDPPPPPPDCNGGGALAAAGGTEVEGSIIDCPTMTLRESVPIAGTPYSLNYSTERVPDRTENRSLDIVLSEGSVPASLQRIDLDVEIAGRTFHEEFLPLPNQVYTFTWDGLDAFGRELQGQQPVTATTGYAYNGVYENAGTFGDYGDGATLGGSGSRQEIVITRRWETTLGTWDARGAGLGGWTLDVHHNYVPSTRQLYLGHGKRVNGLFQHTVLHQRKVFAASGSGIWNLQGAGPDGSLYYSNANRLFRINPDQSTVAIAGTGTPGYTGDGGLATAARIDNPHRVAVGPDGIVYFADRDNHVIRAIDSAGVIRTVAGNGTDDFSGDGGLAIDAELDSPQSVAVAPDGALYIADSGNFRVRRVDPAGIIKTIAGLGDPFGPDDDNVLDNVKATLSFIRPVDLALAPDGTLFIVSGNNQDALSEVSPAGIIRRRVKNIPAVIFEDGGEASEVSLFNFEHVDVASDGTVYFEARFRYDPAAPVQSREAVFALTRGDRIVRVAAGEARPYFAGAPATSVRLNSEPFIAVSPEGLHVTFERFLVRVGPSLPGLLVGPGSLASPSSDEIFVFDQAGRHTETQHPLTGATLQQLFYDAAGLLINVVDADGNVTTIERDGQGTPLAIEAPFGQRTLLELDANGFLSEIANPAAELTLLDSSSGGLLTSFTDPRGGASTMTYDAKGRLTNQLRPNTGEQTLTLLSESDPREVRFESPEGRVRTHTLEKLANDSSSMTNEQPDGTLTEVSRNQRSGATTFTAADGTVTTSTVDPDPRFGISRGIGSSTTRLPSGLTRVETRTRTASSVDPFDLFNFNEEITQTTVNGALWRETYKRSTRTRTLLSPAGRTTISLEDDFGRVLSQQRTGISPVLFDYDAAGRLNTITQGARTSTLNYFDTSDEQNGYLQQVVDALLQTTEYTRDPLGRPLTETYADLSETLFGWDENGNLASVTPPGKPEHVQNYTPLDDLESYVPPTLPGISDPETAYTYNLDRQVTSEVRPDGTSLTWSYDSAGRVDLLTLPSGAIDYEYFGTTPCVGCAPGQLMSIEGPDNVALDFTYDGPLVKSTTWSGDVSGSIAWTYDTDFLPITETITAGAGSSVAHFGYDADNLVTCTSPVTCTPPGTNALKLTYNSAGLPATATLGNLVETFTYNTYGELATHVANYSGSPVFSMTYDSVAAPRDNLGRIMRRSETVLGTARVLDYSYDERGRLIGVAEGATVLSDYDYDDNGNRLSLTTPTDIFNGAYDDQDRLLSYGDLDYTYGENGEVETKTDTVSSDTTTYVYDALGSLLSVELPDTTLIEYVIDGQKRRVGKKVDGVMVQSFLYKDQLRIAAELNGAGAIVSHFSYVGASHSPDYMTKGGALYRFVKDQVGSPRLIVNALTGAIAQELEYDEFGLVTTDTNPGFQPFGFAGGLYDGDTGLTRFGARDYDAVTGRWTSKDPIRWEGGQGNLYLYVGADPLNHIDADGHFLIDLVRSLYHGLLCAYYQTRFADAIEDCREEFDRACEDPICDECLELGGDMGASRFNCLMSKDPAASEGLILHCGGLAGGFAVQRGTIRRGQ